MVVEINKTQKSIVFFKEINFNAVMCLVLIEKPNLLHLKNYNQIVPSLDLR